MAYLGDFSANASLYIWFTTNDSAGGSVAPSSAFEASDIFVVRDDQATASYSASVSVTSPWNSKTGVHLVKIDMSAATFGADAEYAALLIPDETVDGQTVAAVVGQWSVTNRFPNDIATLTNLNSLSANLATNIEAVSANLSSQMDTMSANLATNITALSAGHSARIQELSSSLNTTLATLATSAELATTSANLATNITGLSAGVGTLLATLSGNLATNITSLSAGHSNRIQELSSSLNTALSTLSANLATNIVAAITDGRTEPTAVPTAGASIADKVNWLFMLARNKTTQTSNTITVFGGSASATISQSTISDDATTFTRGQFT